MLAPTARARARSPGAACGWTDVVSRLSRALRGVSLWPEGVCGRKPEMRSPWRWLREEGGGVKLSEEWEGAPGGLRQSSAGL